MAYPGKVRRFERGIALYKRTHVIVQDEITADSPVEALWGMLTNSEISPSGQLRKGDWVVSTRILKPAGARFDAVSTQVPNPRKLVVRLPNKITGLRLVVALTPHPAARPAPALDWKDRPLKRWQPSPGATLR